MIKPSLAGALALVLATTAVSADEGSLVVFDWPGLDLPGLWTDYQEKHGRAPDFSFFADDDEAFQKLVSGFRADVAHPCSQMVRKYRDAGLIEPWDTARIPEFANIYPYMLASPAIMDDTGTWFIPSNFGFTGLVYNPNEVPEADVVSLQVFLDPKYEGRISLPKSSDDIWSLAFLATGVTDASRLTDAQFTAAADWLRKAHPSVRSYWSDSSELAQQMGSGEILLAWGWADIVPTLKASNFPVAFQRQAKEGTAAWFCGFVNLKDGPGSEDLAYDFINAFLSHGSAETLLDAYSSGHANAAALAAIEPAKVKDAQLDPITTPILANLPSDPAMKDRMLKELEMIQSGF